MEEEFFFKTTPPVTGAAGAVVEAGGAAARLNNKEEDGVDKAEGPAEQTKISPAILLSSPLTPLLTLSTTLCLITSSDERRSGVSSPYSVALRPINCTTPPSLFVWTRAPKVSVVGLRLYSESMDKPHIPGFALK